MKIAIFTGVKNRCLLHGRVFVMYCVRGIFHERMVCMHVLFYIALHYSIMYFLNMVQFVKNWPQASSFLFESATRKLRRRVYWLLSFNIPGIPK